MVETYTFYATNLKSLDNDLVEGYISTGDKDLVNDIVTPNCLVDMLHQLQDRVVKIDVEHEAFRGKTEVEKQINKTLVPSGKIISAVLDRKGILVTGKLNPFHVRYNETKGSIKEGFLDAFSIAYIPTAVQQKGEDRYLDKVNLLNVAFTGNPVNPEASFTNIMMKSLADVVRKDNGGVIMKAEGNSEALKPMEVKDVPVASIEVKDLITRFDALSKEFRELKAQLKTEEEDAAKKKKEEEDAAKKKKEEEDAIEAKKKSLKAEETEEEALARKKKEEADAKACKKSLDQEAEIKSMAEKIKSMDAILSAPQFKSKVENMKAVLNDVTPSATSRGPLDLFK